MLEQPDNFRLGEYFHLCVFLRREFTANGGIFGKQAFVDRLLESGPADGMTGAYHSVGQLCAFIFHVLFSACPFQFCVKLLQVVLRELVEGYLTNAGYDMHVDSVFIGGVGCYPKLWFGEILIPKIYPISQKHIGFQPFRDSSVLIFQRCKFFKTLVFGVGEYAFCLGKPFFVVADDHAAFPSPVCAKAYRAFALFSFLI